ncbi:MAG: GHKL domain-containing protein [Desulfobacterales bacterium]|nr:MAG: GHKL domain-containing protein [Desulfobacterales bacterium]
MNARVAALRLLADRWTERVPPDFSPSRFLEFAGNLYTHYPGFTGINWIDPEGFIRWVFPEERNATLLDKNIAAHVNSQVRAAFQVARKDFNYAVTPCVDLWQGGLGFDTFYPLIYAGELQGILNGVFQVSRIVDLCLARNLITDFWIRIYEAGRLIYSNERRDPRNLKNDPLHVFQEIGFAGKTWQLRVTPTAAIYPTRAMWNFPLLAFSLAASAGLALLLHFFLQRMQMYRQARDQALREVGERKLAEQALKTNEKKLETLLVELAAKNEELEAFVYTVSHDLKSPVVTIEGFMGALREDFGDLISAEGQKYLGYISDAARKIELLINDLLELSRIGRLPEMKKEFPFADLVAEALKSLPYQVTQKGIEVTVQEDLPRIYGEKKRLVQVLENLLSNAVKYIGKQNPRPRIDVGVSERKGRKVFFVRDNGIGIEARHFERIFGIFQRLPSEEDTGAGTGVGLTIVKRIIERHGGQIWLESEPGKGSTFFFTLEAREEA